MNGPNLNKRAQTSYSPYILGNSVTWDVEIILSCDDNTIVAPPLEKNSFQSSHFAFPRFAFFCSGLSSPFPVSPSFALVSVRLSPFHLLLLWSQCAFPRFAFFCSGLSSPFPFGLLLFWSLFAFPRFAFPRFASFCSGLSSPVPVSPFPVSPSFVLVSVRLFP